MPHTQDKVKLWPSAARFPKPEKPSSFSSATYLQSLLAQVDHAAIAARMKQARLDAGLHQRDVAERFDTHENTVQNWENGYKSKKSGQHMWPVPWNRLPELAELYGVTTGWLQWGDEPASQVEAQADRLADAIERLNTVLELLERKLA